MVGVDLDGDQAQPVREDLVVDDRSVLVHVGFVEGHGRDLREEG